MTDVADDGRRYLGLRPRTAADTDGEVSRILGKLEAADLDATIARLLANAPTVFRPFVLLSDALLNRCALSPRVRELVVLELARRTNSSYEWAEHVRIARRAGVEDRQIEALHAGEPDGSAGFSPAEIAALTVAESMLTQGRIPASVRAEAERHFSAREQLELVTAVAWWGGFVPMVLDALELEADDVG